MRKTLIQSGLVLVDNERFEDVSLLLENGRISELLPAEQDVADAHILDARDRLVIPGLVNAHTHSHGALGRGGVSDAMTLETFLAGASWLNMQRQSDDLRLAAELSAVELIRKGCTACFDLFVEMPGPSIEGIHTVAEAYDTVGMRAVVAPMIADQTIFAALPGLLDAFEGELRGRVAAITLPDWQSTMAVCTEALRSWPVQGGRVRPGIGPTIPLHCSDAFLRACAALSSTDGIPLQTHLAETRMQQVMAQAKYGVSLTEHLSILDVLSERFSGAHGVWLSDPEMELLAGHGAGISHNPMSNLRLGSGVAPLHRMRRSGVGLGIGTDASNTSDGQNMFEAMRLAATLSRAATSDPAEWVSARAAFIMATEGSAALMGLKNVGRIAPGWAADLVLLDRRYCHYTPLRRALDQVVLAENGAAVREVIIDGRTVFAEGRMQTIDEAALAVRAQAAADRIDHANRAARVTAEAATAVVQSFCSRHCAARLPSERI